MTDAPLPEFAIARTFDTSIERMWQAWTDPTQVGWLGPKGTDITILESDVRPGGKRHWRMEMGEMPPMYGVAIFREVRPPTKLVWEHSFGDVDGNITGSPFGGAWPAKLLTTVIFTEKGKSTEVHLTWSPLDATREEIAAFVATMASMTDGWGGSFDRLAENLAA